MSFEIILPEMGEGVIEGALTRWLVRAGEAVEAYAPVAEVETDKVTTELFSEVAGTVLTLHVQEGEIVPVGTVVATIRPQGEAHDARPLPAERAPLNGRPPAVYGGRISPVVGRIAAEHSVDLNLVTGTGKEGRITKRDILAYVERADSPPGDTTPLKGAITLPAGEREAQVAAAWSSASSGGDQLQPLSGMRRAIAEHMLLSKQTSPHVTTVFEFDFAAVSAHRRLHKERFLRDGARLTFTAYVVAAVARALKEHPLANSVWTEEGILLKKGIHIGMATAVAGGLIVPVIKDADGLNLLGLARTINDLAERARGKQLRPEEVQGGTFSITNHGTSGSLLATPIINQPQAGILGIGKIEKRVTVIGDAIAIRPMAYASFTFDHRILDGATADAFAGHVKSVIEAWR